MFADADLDAAAQGIAVGIFANQGEVCAAGSRILVAAVGPRRARRPAGPASLRGPRGDPFEETTTMGALISCSPGAAGRGTTSRSGGPREPGSQRAARAHTDRAYFVEPTLFVGAHNSMTDRPRGDLRPVGTILSFDRRRGSRRDRQRQRVRAGRDPVDLRISRAHTLAAAIRAGSVAVNGWAPIDPRLPWGGSKLSGDGRELGWAGIEANTEEKTISVVL